ncbi:class I glutamine amidotransferase-like protein [Mrakia frigida]|uniref:type 1 glutamine amidotransferase n=1 Tax=Mrakia frigida TaxID=29902 RepID=UPI003FCC1E6E
MSTSSPKNLRIALLLADTPNPYVLAEEGTYLDVFRAHLLDSLANMGRKDDVDLEITGFDIVGKQEFPEDRGFEKGGFDAVMITGSAHCSYDDVKNPWIPKTLAFIRKIASEYPHVRIIGTCFGMQLLVRAYGGEVVKNPLGWEIGTYEMNLTPIGSKLLSSSSSSSTTPSSTISIQQMHADYAPALPSEGEWELLARTEKTEVQGLVSFYGEAEGEGEEKGKVHILGWEGHPEFTQSIVDKIIRFRSDSGVFTPSMASEATERAARAHDGRGRIGAMMLKVMLGEL